MSLMLTLRRHIVKEARHCQLLLRNVQRSVPSTASTSRCFSSLRHYLRSTPNEGFLLYQRREIKNHPTLYADIPVRTPAFPESINDGDVKWLKDDGVLVKKDEVVCEIETDKTAIPVPSPVDGKLKRIVPDGQKVEAGNLLYTITEVGGGSATSSTASTSTPVAKPSASTPMPAPSPKSPVIKPPVIKPPTTPQIKLQRGETITKMSRIRKVITKRLKDSQNTYIMLTTFNEIDMSYVIDFRKKNQKAHVSKHGVKLGFMSAFVKAVTYALQEQPVFNAHIQDEAVIKKKFIDISVAVATPKGLLVPILKDVEKMKLWEIEKGIMELSKRAREGTIETAEMEGGSFTITNGGIFGSLLSSPIINPPQSGILGMHGIFERPVAVDGKVVIRPMMYVALTYDHRLVDGREAVLFLRRIKKGVEDTKQLATEL